MRTLLCALFGAVAMLAFSPTEALAAAPQSPKTIVIEAAKTEALAKATTILDAACADESCATLKAMRATGAKFATRHRRARAMAHADCHASVRVADAQAASMRFATGRRRFGARATLSLASNSAASLDPRHVHA